jgi:hypothetical protein
MKTIIRLWLALAAVVHAAGLHFPETLKEIHAPVDATKVTALFEFTNRGDKPVSVRKYDAACSCMGLHIKDSKLRYAPGEAGVIRADFEMGNFSGTVDKVVAIWLDDDPESAPSVKLTVRVHIPVMVVVEPKTVSWQIGGEATPQSIRITMNDQRPIHVKAVTSSSPAFSTQLKTIEDGRLYELVVTPTKIGTPGMGILRIETDAAQEKNRLQQAFAVVRKLTPAEAAAKP